MATYVYETTDPKKPICQFEMQQSMKDDALTEHPESGEPIRRVITGGYLSTGSSAGPASQQSGGTSGGGSCGSGCGCH